MKRSTLAAIAVASTLVVSNMVSMQATASESDALCAAISVEVSQPGVCVSENDGVVTLTGVVESTMDKDAAERAALSHEGVTEVINMISVSD